jgi:hypothetical protein
MNDPDPEALKKVPLFDGLSVTRVACWRGGSSRSERGRTPATGALPVKLLCPRYGASARRPRPGGDRGLASGFRLRSDGFSIAIAEVRLLWWTAEGFRDLQFGIPIPMMQAQTPDVVCRGENMVADRAARVRVAREPI